MHLLNFTSGKPLPWKSFPASSPWSGTGKASGVENPKTVLHRFVVS
ncbi:hypothetical protein WKK05_10305 [Nostoc sp. UHCC 0302]